MPLAVLALFAAAEFAAQYFFIATPFAQAVGIPDSALRFIEVRGLTCSEFFWQGQGLSMCTRGLSCIPGNFKLKN